MNPNGRILGKWVDFRIMVARVENMIFHLTGKALDDGVGEVRLPTTDWSSVQSSSFIDSFNNVGLFLAANSATRPLMIQDDIF